MLPDKFFFILKDNLIESNDSTLKIISLRNPATKNATKYLMQRDDSKRLKNSFYELNCFNEEHRSWFINQSVCSNGKILMPTPIDPLFLALPYLEENCSNKAAPLDQVFVDEKFPFTCDLVEALDSFRLSLIADEKRAGKIVAYKYNETKALEWLVGKCKRLSEVVGKQDGPAARSMNYVKEEKENEKEENAASSLSTAFGIIGDYLSLEVSHKLSQALGFPEDDNISKKRKSAVDLESAVVKKIKKEDIHQTTPIKLPTTEKKISAKAKALAKAAGGSKSISSFFKK